MKLLITGASGFVGKHFIARCHHYFSRIIGITNTSEVTIQQFPNVEIRQLDLLKFNELCDLVKKEHLDAVLHLAGLTSAGASKQRPYETIYVNSTITLNLLEVIRRFAGNCRFLYVSSADIYANSEVPIKEDHLLDPQNPYAVSKLNGEYTCKTYATCYGIPVIITRPFNHTGPGQSYQFFIPSVIKQISNLVEQRGVIEVGNIDVVREFLDVRDVCDAYLLLLQKNICEGTYNVSAGKGYLLRDVIELIASIYGKKVQIKVDPVRYRKNEKNILVGDASKLNQLGWSHKYTLKDTLLYIKQSSQIVA
ncbi:MAG: GDP-mannose 4,6-dehydratase [Patescibacteria group bacterium]|nr:GDP-mannose 4,6-dehydratase [Patescibacteria group bacterium]